MVQRISTAACLASLLLPLCGADGLYTKKSPVLQVDGRSYYSDIARSNHTSIVEFYAPWCGHCQNLKPAYEKAAKSLAGLAKVAAVNCDEESNKPFCGSMDVKGFPTLKIVRPGKKPGKPFVEDYQGPRSAKGIVDAVKDKIPNHVKRLTDKTVDEWLSADATKPKAILFSEKGATSALIKALAIDYLGSISIGQARDKETAISDKYSVTSYPSFVLLPGDGKDPITYSGALEKKPMSDFLSQAATPNPDPAPKKPKPAKPAGNKSDSSKLSAASSSHRSADSASSRATQTSETVVEPDGESPGPIPGATQQPIAVPAPFLPLLMSDDDVRSNCLTTKSGTCVLIFQPGADAGVDTEMEASAAMTALAELHNKHVERGASSIFPSYAVPGATEVRKVLGLKEGEMSVVAVNGKRGWMKRFPGSGYGKAELEDWVDSLRMGEGKKEKLAEGVLIEPVEAGKAASEKEEGAKAKVEETAEGVREVVEETAHETEGVKEKVMSKADEIKEGVKSKAEELKEAVKEKVDQVKEKVAPEHSEL